MSFGNEGDQSLLPTDWVKSEGGKMLRDSNLPDIFALTWRCAGYDLVGDEGPKTDDVRIIYRPLKKTLFRKMSR